MSRHWSEYKYLDAQSLWEFIDEQSMRMDIIAQYDSVESSELCKLILLGRREMLDAFCTFLSENEVPIGDIVTDRHCVFTKDELRKLINRDFEGE
jgi:hypothetical protein